jgi:hypothetical protein
MSAASWASNCILGILAAPLLIAGTAKLAARADRISWPYSAGLLAPPHGPRLVGAAEIAAAAVAVLLPSPLAGAIAALAYATLTVAAQRLRGHRCACFGVARLAAVGRAHVSANAAAALLAAALVPAAGGSDLPLRGLGLAVAAAALLAVLWQLDRRAVAGTGAPACAEPVRSVRVYVSENCPACRSLGTLLARMDDTRGSLVSTVVVHETQALPPALQGLGVPCATALDAGGQAICSPVSGIGDVKALVDKVVIGVDEPAHAH